MTPADLTYSYRAPSVVRQGDGRSELLLATSGGVTEAGPAVHPYFFSGFLTEPDVAATGMLACAAVARSRYFLPGNVVAILRDPVVTSNRDRLRFEAFSSCCGVHARLDLLPTAFAEPPVTSGTTNVDFNDAMRAALAGAAIRGPLLLSVGSGEVVLGRKLTAALDLVRRGGVPGPAPVLPTAGQPLPPPVTDPEELVQLLTMLIEDASDAIAAERALAGAVRLSSLPATQRRKLAAPLLKRTDRVIHAYSPFYGDLITSDMAIIANVWGGGRPVRDKADHREHGWHMPGDYAVSSTGQALTMAGIFSARAWEATRIIAAGQGGVLLAAPETERGAISAETLLQRIRELAAHPDAVGRLLKHDREQALLRLEPGEARAELWKAWAPVADQSADALRESHQVIQSAVSFEAVTGEPTGRPLRASQEWYTHLLARTTAKVPTAPCCDCWQLLTDLADPLRDHEVLYGPSRFQARHYDAAVAGWTLICPWQPEIAAAHLLRPLSDGLIPGITPATVAMTSMRHLAHALGPVGHLALATGLSSAEADTRIAAAGLWADAAADGRLDPALAAAAIATGVGGDALKLSRIASGLEYAAHTELAARRIVETVCAALAALPPGPANMHRLVELAARLGARTGVPELPAAVREMAARRRSSRISATARQLQAAASSEAPDRSRAGAQALSALVMRAETAAG